MNPFIIIGALGAAVGVVFLVSRKKAGAGGGGGNGGGNGGGAAPVLVAIDDLVIS